MSHLWQRLAHASGVLAVIRLTAIPVFFAAERLVGHPHTYEGPFGPLLLVAGAYAVATLVAELRGRPLGPPALLAAADIAFVAALVETSGGPFSQLRYAFFMLPVSAGLLLRPALTAAASAASVLLYALIAVTYQDGTQMQPDAAGFEVTQGLFLAWMGGAATMLSALLTRRTRQVAELAASRGRLVAQALDAEDVARRRLAEKLHDDALQNLLAARQLLGSGNGADLEMAAGGLDQSIRQIRQAVFDLHPYLLEQGGLRAALQAVAASAAERSGFTASVDVDPAAEGLHDQLAFSIARELITNAAKHADASRLDLAVRRRTDAVDLIAIDDGRGIDPDQVRAAPLRGHIGLASCRERAEAIGGSFEIAQAPIGSGTRVRVSLPAPALVP